ncbi:MAG TPA: beta-N-acetylhexosaminidase [Gemmatimonadaceae bacterium]
MKTPDFAWPRQLALGLTCAVLTAGCRATPSTGPSPRAVTRHFATTPRVIPAPTSLALSSSDSFSLTATTSILVDSGNAEVARTAELLALVLRPSTGFPIPVSSSATSGGVALRLNSTRAALGAEGYELAVTRDSVRIVAATPAGLFHGVQTLRQLFPPEIESQQALSGSWAIPAVTIVDQPRFAWRGSMLDVARHFFTVREVKQYIDLLALYKLNVLHLHLSDDQGWRIEIKSRPQLTNVGGRLQVGGGPAGFYTQDDYTDIVRYAQERYITIVPEIDMPAHINAALVSHPELSCGTRPPMVYTGTEVGFSSLCPEKEETYALVDDVVREIAALTPAPYFHIGGDEVQALTHERYARFIERVQDIVGRRGKQMVGWEEITRANLRPTTLVQQWANDTVAAAATRYGAKLILSPAPRMYLDMKYTPSTELGLHWAAFIEVRDAYDWDPATYIKGVTERDIVGIEAPVWSETLRNITAVEYLVMPRLPALAEVGWTAQATRNWENFRDRLPAHAPRWNYLGVNFYRSPQIPW